MPIQIEGQEYLTVSDLVEELGVSRQTIWRWRQQDKIPQGNTLRGRWVVFTPREVDAIRAFAFQLQPLDTHEDQDQITLFTGGQEGRST